MAYEFYMTAVGTTQKSLKGESTRTAHKAKAPCISFEYAVTSPRDVATGLASGKRQHKPVIVTKELGASTPQLFQACVTNEVLTSVLFEFIHTTAEGKEEIYYTIKLTNATISSVRQFTAEAAKHEETAATHELEEISFTFQKLDMEHTVAKTAATDDWNA
jgi:type VI secretion system secreted protein Hcp